MSSRLTYNSSLCVFLVSLFSFFGFTIRCSVEVDNAVGVNDGGSLKNQGGGNKTASFFNSFLVLLECIWRPNLV